MRWRGWGGGALESAADVDGAGKEKDVLLGRLKKKKEVGPHSPHSSCTSLCLALPIILGG